MATAITIDVIRDCPPSVGRCKSCDRRIEWVTTTARQRKMPVDAPMLIERVVAELTGGRTRVTIDAAHSHFVTCPDADRFRRRKVRR